MDIYDLTLPLKPISKKYLRYFLSDNPIETDIWYIKYIYQRYLKSDTPIKTDIWQISKISIKKSQITLTDRGRLSRRSRREAGWQSGPVRAPRTDLPLPADWSPVWTPGGALICSLASMGPSRESGHNGQRMLWWMFMISTPLPQKIKKCM